MVAQMVVTIADCDVEGHTAEQLREVGFDMLGVAAGTEELGEFEVTRAFALLTAQQCHCRCIEAALPAHTVEALHAEGVEFIVQPHQPSLGDVDAGLAGHGVDDELPGTDVAVVITRREFTNPQRAILFGEVRLWARATQRRTRGIVREAEQRGRILGVRQPMQEEGEDEPWTLPASRRRKEPPIAGELRPTLELVLADQIYIARHGLPPGLMNSC